MFAKLTSVEQHNRGFSYGDASFSEAKESKEEYRGFTYNNPNVTNVDYQRNSMYYTSYEVPRQFHRFPAPAFAVLLDPHQPRNIAQDTISNIISNRYVDRQV